MRIIDEIPHERFKITVFSWNEKYIVKFEIADYEQVYKFNQRNIMSVNDVKTYIMKELFLKNVMDRFLTMRSDHLEIVKSIEI